MVVYDDATKVLDTEIFPQHTIADLNLWHYRCFQSGEDFTVNRNKHTHTYTHTCTHAHKHKHTNAVLPTVMIKVT